MSFEIASLRRLYRERALTPSALVTQLHARPGRALPAPRFRFGVPKAMQLEFFGNREYAALFDVAVAQLTALGGERVEIDLGRSWRPRASCTKGRGSRSAMSRSAISSSRSRKRCTR